MQLFEYLGLASEMIVKIRRCFVRGKGEDVAPRRAQSPGVIALSWDVGDPHSNSCSDSERLHGVGLSGQLDIQPLITRGIVPAKVTVQLLAPDISY